jgi:hypothetical protein
MTALLRSAARTIALLSGAWCGTNTVGWLSGEGQGMYERASVAIPGRGITDFCIARPLGAVGDDLL